MIRTRLQGDTPFFPNMLNNGKVEVCLKEDVDKVIAHHKRKRCVAMANYWGLLVACTHREIQLKCMRRELKWHKLAEKFKPNKKQ